MHDEQKGERETKDRFILRFDSPEQRAALKVRAEKNRRTMNAEILFLMERGQEKVDGTTD